MPWTDALGYIDALVVGAAALWYIWSQDRRSENNGEKLEGIHQMAMSLQTCAAQLSKAVEHLDSTIEKMDENSSREHREMLGVMSEVRSSMASDHKEMILIMQATKEPLIEAVAVLKSHVAETHRRG